MNKINSLHFFSVKSALLSTLSIIFILTCFCLYLPALAEDITSKEKVLFYTSEWQGERLPDFLHEDFNRAT